MSKGTTFKRCSCSEPVLDEHGQRVLDRDGKPKRRQLGARCPALRRPDGSWNRRHGSWYYVLELPEIPGDRWRQIKRGGYPTQTDAQDALDQVRLLVGIARDADDPGRTRGEISALIQQANRQRTPLPDYDQLRRRCLVGQVLDEQMTVADWLTEWVTTKVDVRTSTKRIYAVHIRRYLIPHLGDHRLDRLRVAHVQAMFAAITEHNEQILADIATRHLLRQALQTARREGRRQAAKAARAKLAQLPSGHERPAWAATQQRIRATLRAALSDAARQQLITLNVAKLIKLPSGKRPKALVWTEERVTRWRKTGQKPSPVMVWTAPQTAAFLTGIATVRLYPLYHLIAHLGLRRGEACGVRWSDVDLQARTLTVAQQIVQLGWETEVSKPKSDAGDRVVPLDTSTVTVLRAWRHRQQQERLACGPAWIDTDLIFTEPDGAPLHPSKVTGEFNRLTRTLDLPPIRLHDLRHGTATHALSAGVDIKIVQELLGHSSSVITSDTYTSVIDEAKRAATEAIAALLSGPEISHIRTEVGD